MPLKPNVEVHSERGGEVNANGKSVPRFDLLSRFVTSSLSRDPSCGSQSSLKITWPSSFVRRTIVQSCSARFASFDAFLRNRELPHGTSAPEGDGGL